MTTKRSLRLIVGAALAGAALLATSACAPDGGSESSGGESRTLTYATFVPDTNPHAITSQWFMDEITERTDGRITFDATYLEAGCPAAELYQCASDGRADVVFSAAAFEPQKFPVTLVSAIQYYADSNDHKARAFQEFFETTPAAQAEYEDENLHLLGVWSTRLVLGGTGEAWTGPDDLSGKDIRTVGGPATTALALAGANPIGLTSNEVYEALQRGVVDGYAFSLEGVVQFSLTDYSDFLIDPRAGGYSSFSMVMNKATYDSLDAEDQAIIDELAAELPSRAVEELATVTDAACETLLEDEDFVFEQWSQAEADDWRDLASDELRADWEKSATDNGVEDASEVFESWIAAVDSVTDSEPDAEVACAEEFADR